MQKTSKSTANGKRIDKELVLLSANFLLLGERLSLKLRLCVSPSGFQLSFISPRAAHPLTGSLTLGFYVACLPGRLVYMRQPNVRTVSAHRKLHTKKIRVFRGYNSNPKTNFVFFSLLWTNFLFFRF